MAGWITGHGLSADPRTCPVPPAGEADAWQVGVANCLEAPSCQLGVWSMFLGSLSGAVPAKPTISWVQQPGTSLPLQGQGPSTLTHRTLGLTPLPGTPLMWKMRPQEIAAPPANPRLNGNN